MRPHCLRTVPLQQADVFRRGLRALLRDAHWTELGASGSALVIERHPLGLPLRMTSRGPLWKEGASLADRTDALRAARLTIINAETEDPALRAAGFRQLVTPAHVAILPTGDRDRVLSRAFPKWRNRARLLRKAGLTVREQIFDPVEHDWIRRVDAEAQKRKRYRSLPFGLTLAMSRVAPEAVRVFRVDRHGAPLAVMLIVLHGTDATYHLGWCGPDGRDVSAHHGMLVAVADWAAARGIASIDLGRVDTDTAPGLARFKLGSGAVLQRLGGTWGRLPGLGWT